MEKLLDKILKNHLASALIIIFFTSVVRFVFIATSQINLSPDEAQYWDWSRHLQLSYYSKGPLIAWINYFWTGLLGDTELGVRFGALFNSICVQMILYFGLAKIWKRPNLALLSLIIANTMPLFLAASILMTTDSHLLLSWLIAFFALYALVQKPNSLVYLSIFTLSVALGILAKYMMYAFAITIIIYLFILYREKLLIKNAIRNICLAFVLGSILGTIPLLIWNMANDFVGLKHILTLAGLSSNKVTTLIRFDTLPDFLASQFALVSPWWMIMCLVACYQSTRLFFFKAENISATKEEALQNGLLISGFIPIWCGLALWSLHSRIYPNWAAMSYVSGIILASITFEQIIMSKYSQKIKKWTYSCLYVSLALFVIMYAQQILPLPEKFDPTLKTKGYSDLGQKLAELEQGMPNPDKVFYFSEIYGTTAALAFYAPNQPTTYCAATGRRKNQYDFWQGPQDKVGYDAIFVRPDNNPPSQAVQDMFESMELIPYTSSHKGKKAKDFTIAILHNYNGKWESIEAAPNSNKY